MSIFFSLNQELHRRQTNGIYKGFWQRLHVDLPLLMSILILMSMGLVILYSAAYEDLMVVIQQSFRLLFGFSVMLACAQISPQRYKTWAPWLYLVGAILLVLVLAIGKISKGAQRWLDLGFFRFQPSELMKLAVPLMVAWYFSHFSIPPKFRHLIVATIIIMVPSLLIMKQPDLGTALMIMIAGGSVVLFAGISWLLLGSVLGLIGASVPFLWRHLHDYQKNRVLTFLDPEKDPLGTGYHIIQSKIAIGSGGIFGKGWLNGSQAQLDFLPEHATDFIFAVCGEEFGLVGCILLLCIVFIIVMRAFYIATHAKDTFARILAGGLGLTFFISVFVNMGMVIGILPVVGIPFPLVSYGGTAVVTIMASFGILMAIQTDKRLLPG